MRVPVLAASALDLTGLCNNTRVDPPLAYLCSHCRAMIFCPICCNCLVAERYESGQTRLECPTCTYVHSVTTRLERNVRDLPEKQADDVMGGAAAWELADKTSAVCERCQAKEAYFFQMQTRSADEPMSTFYRCVECKHQWKEG